MRSFSKPNTFQSVTSFFRTFLGIKPKVKTFTYSFCESVTASSTSKWHIRKLTDQGKKLGGGADTKALCGQEVSWDLSVDFTYRKDEILYYHTRACSKCHAFYLDEQGIS